MKNKIWIVGVLAVCALAGYADQWGLNDCVRSGQGSVRRIEGYVRNAYGFWERQAPRQLDSVPVAAEILGRVDKDKRVYLLSDLNVLEVSLDKSGYKRIKKDAGIPKLKDWENVYAHLRLVLEDSVGTLNEMRSVEVEDSLARERELRRLEQERIEKLHRDSVAKAEKIHRDSVEVAEYRRETHSKVNFEGERSFKLKCLVDGCDYTYVGKQMSPLLISGDTVLVAELKEFPLGITEDRYHACIMPEELRGSKQWDLHMRAWGDSLKTDDDSVSLLRLSDYSKFICATNFLDRIKRDAPYGYISDWGWNCDYGMVGMNVDYVNTNAQTIKYIQFWFTVYNDVDDVRGRGHINCTGPVEQWGEGSWNSDYTGCFVAGDASRMKISKVVITYMNGKTRTLSGKQIVFD